MQASITPDSTVLVIFGAGGDLTWRKLVPALYSLFVDHWLPDQFSRRSKSDDAAWAAFAANLAFVSADFADPAAYSALAERLGKQDHDWGGSTTHVFYLATPPALMGSIAENLGRAGLAG